MSTESKDMPINLSEISIFVATQKRLDPPEDGAFFLTQSGAAVHEDLGVLRDDEGENISSRNALYSELCIQYWAWKNAKAKIVGLVHDRRYFAPLSEAISYEHHAIASSRDLATTLLSADLIAVEPIYLMQPNSTNLYSVEGQYVHSHGYDLLVAREVVLELFPAYRTAFDLVMRNSKLIPYNLLVARRDSFHEYSEWLFKILFAIEPNVQPSFESGAHKRILGFLSERLMTVWIAHNWRKLKVAFRPHVFLKHI